MAASHSAASSSSCATHTHSHTTVYLPNILLDETNYPTWIFRMESFLRGQNLFGYVDGTFVCPPQFVLATDGVTSSVSLDYINWKTQDQSIINMIGQTLSPVAMTCAVGSKSAKQLWENLREKFAAPNKQNILQLKSNLQNLKKGHDDIEAFLDKIKVARDALETVGVTVDDEDVVVTVLRGLPAEFAAIKTVIRAQYCSASLATLKTLLKAAEVDIELESQSTLPLTAMIAKNNSSISTDTTATSSTMQANLPQPLAMSTPLHQITSSAPSTSMFSQPQSQMQPVLSAPSTSMFSQPQSQMQPVLPAPATPPGFNTFPIPAHTTYSSIPAIPYGFSPLNAYTMMEPMLPITGFFAGRGNTRFNNSPGGRVNNFGARNGGFGFNNNVNSGFNNGNNGGFGFNNNTINSGFNNNGGRNNSISCQLCGRTGHGARTCRTLSNYPGINNGQNFNNNNGGCQFCGKMNHTAERCYYIIGFPNQQQQQNEDKEATAMIAATTNAPQFWLADTGATNHMTSNAHMLNNLVSYPGSDSVQIGQGVGQSTLQRTE